MDEAELTIRLIMDHKEACQGKGQLFYTEKFTKPVNLSFLSEIDQNCIWKVEVLSKIETFFCKF